MIAVAKIQDNWNALRKIYSELNHILFQWRIQALAHSFCQNTFNPSINLAIINVDSVN
jgi:hypothetical protein